MDFEFRYSEEKKMILGRVSGQWFQALWGQAKHSGVRPCIMHFQDKVDRFVRP